LSGRLALLFNEYLIKKHTHIKFQIIHIVLDSQDKNGNYALDFDDSVNKATKRLVDQYIQQFKASHSKSIMTPSKEISHTRKQDKLPHPDAIRTALKDLASSSSTAR
jgi:hypothetical protein